MTIMASQLGMIIALKKAIEIFPSLGAEIYCKHMTNFYRGTGLEIYRRETFECPDESEYIQCAIFKYSVIFGLVTDLIQACGGNEQNFSKLVGQCALFYSVSNDYSDYIINDGSEGKRFCDDVTEGKFNFPIIHAVKTAKNNEILGKQQLL